jgi:predicted nucleic acid-binding protein
VRHWRTIAIAADERVVYADSSALVKLVVGEPESGALREYLGHAPARLASSRVARIEVTRAVRLANPSLEVQADARSLFEEMLLVPIGDVIIEAACHLASTTIRTLDAIHLAAVQLVDPDEAVIYDRRLGEAARGLGYVTVAPGSRY